MVDIKNIIIIGKTGSGKSALANVLSNSDEFKEESSSLTKVWRAVDKEFEDQERKIKYRVIDTIGLGDKKLTKKELLEKFEEEIGTYIDEGISQIFFVMDDWRLSEKVLEKFLWLNETFFDNEAFDYTTVVRNNFPNFRSKQKCQEDIEKLTIFFNDINGESYAEINSKVLEKEKVIHVDNPPFDENLRQKSNKKILDYLKKNKFSDGESYRSNLRKWLDEKYPKSERGNKTVLDISNQKLKGRLSLKGFTNLKRLNCSNNQLISLDLNDCKILLELNCASNKFTNLNFLKSVSSDNLEQLNISNCPLKGDLQPLKSLNKLETLFITNTTLGGYLEHLPSSCKKLVCNSNPPTKIMEILKKSGCLEEDQYNKKYYNLDKWQEINKQNKTTAKVIPSERLFVIRSNIKQFLKKWGTKDKNNQTELSKLQNPQEINTYWYLGESGQWLARGTAVTGGILAATVNPILGGVLAAVSPIVEISASQMKERLYEAKQNKWEQFLTDADNFLDNFNELLGTLRRIAGEELGEVNLKLKELKEQVDNFLQDYDTDGNREIDMEELINARVKFNSELPKLEKIEQAIKELEKEVIKYKKGSISKEEVTELKSETQPTTLEIKLAQRKQEREQLEQKRNELTIKLKEAEIDYQQIRKELDNKREDLFLLTDADEELELLNKEIIDLKNELKTIKQKKEKTKKQLIKVKTTLFKQQIRSINLGEKMSQWWEANGEYMEDWISNVKIKMSIPVYLWEVCCDQKDKQKGKEVESQVESEPKYEEQIEVSPYQKT